MSHWTLVPSQLVPVIAVGVGYGLRTRVLAAKGRPVARRRQVCLAAGLVVALVALVSPIDWLGENRLLWVHMVQHLMLGDLAPLLLVCGCTGAVLRPVLAVRGLRVTRLLLHPLVALPLWIVDLYAWHLPVLYQAALAHETVHALEHACFAVCGTLMWAAVIEPLPGPEWFSSGFKALYTLVVRAAGTILSFVFIWDGHVLYPHYAALERLVGVAPLTDQRIAGLIMFTEGGVVTLVAFGWLFLRMTRESEIRQRLIERQVEERAAARAARYGRSSRVREVSER
jgi:cytochrome c oxidase assembly factor CtaG